MRLVESTSKELLSRYGLAPPAGVLCSTAAEARVAAENLRSPVYVKAQIPFGDRAKHGLVVRADDPEAAARHADTLVGRVVEGTAIPSVLVESAAVPRLTAYISAHVDDEAAARILRIGIGGGVGYNPDDAQVRVNIPLHGLEMYEIRCLLAKAGLIGATREAVTRAAMAVVRAAREWHAYTVEVNPLFVTEDGALAVDAKIELDDYSLKSVPDRSLLHAQTESPREREARAYQEQDHRGSLRYVQLVDEADAHRNGTLVGSHSVGGGESLVVFDALDAVRLRPANYCDTSGAPSQEKVAFAAQLIASQPHIAGYFFSSCIANQPLSVTARGLVLGFEQAGWRGPTLVRIAGNEESEAREIVEAWARANDIPARVVGRELHEWEAARLLADLLAGGKG